MVVIAANQFVDVVGGHPCWLVGFQLDIFGVGSVM